MRWLPCVFLAGCSFGGDPGGVPIDAREPDAPPPSSPRKLVLDATGIATPLANVPILVSLTPAQIDYAKVGNAATDLKFTSGTETLPHEIEQWIPGGESLVWVRVPAIAAGATDGSILMHFGAGEGAPDPVALWQGNEVVTHMRTDAGSLDRFPNSLGATYPATAINVMQYSGQISYGVKLDPAGDRRLELADSGALFSNWSAFTLELWLRPEYATMEQVIGEPGVVDKGGGLTLGRVFKAGVAPSQSLKFQIDWTFPSDTIRVSSVIEPRAWNYLVYTYDGTIVQLYRNGELAAAAVVQGGKMLAPSTAPFFLGSNANALTGIVDELRISQQMRTADWIKLQYRSMTRQVVRFTDP